MTLGDMRSWRDTWDAKRLRRFAELFMTGSRGLRVRVFVPWRHLAIMVVTTEERQGGQDADRT
jgi:hypothetical protein